MSYFCELAELRMQQAITIRSQISVDDLPEMFEQTYTTLVEYLEELGENPAGPPFAIYYNLESDNLDIEAGFPVSKKLPGKGNINATEVVIEKAASCLHIGPYSDIESAYVALMEWMKTNGHEPTGVAYEFYLNDPGVTPPEELRTEILMPLLDK